MEADTVVAEAAAAAATATGILTKSASGTLGATKLAG